ncbi:hypothetical protein HY734_02895 [Candidatus Uhrbacteria bacterium]|nr:hypothetical protein [Candidatus Uhrbacteria bacterium]
MISTRSKQKRPVSFSTMQARFQQAQEERRRLIPASNDALNRSKRAIFALHRDDLTGAVILLKEAAELLDGVERGCKRSPELAGEGSYQAALEEYAEAVLFRTFLQKGTFDTSDRRILKPSVFLGGLADATGELVRYAVRQATRGQAADVRRIHEMVDMAVAYLLELDLTGNLRQKLDQAKRNLRSLEDMLYDLTLKARIAP